MKITLASLCLVALTGAVLTSCGAGTLLQTMGSGGTIANIFTSVIGMDKVTEKGLIGTWRYDSPGVAFTSENLLAKAGGEVAATKIEQGVRIPSYNSTRTRPLKLPLPARAGVARGRSTRLLPRSHCKACCLASTAMPSANTAALPYSLSRRNC